MVVVGYHVSHRTMAYAATPTDKQPIVVELFSSEGCSSCPPADTVLRQLVRDQPVAGAEVLGLELHVDYWNYLGWVDPFSSEAFTARQRAYADALGQHGVYTPQLVVDGTTQCVGSNAATARSLIAAAAREPKATVRLSRTGDRVSIAVSDLPAKAEPADVWLAITEDDLVTAVPRGENAGGHLAHGPVVRILRRVGTMATRDPLEIRDVAVDLRPEWRRDHLRAVSFVQRRGSLRILGAAAIAMR
jgi:hypothetical protein